MWAEWRSGRSLRHREGVPDRGDDERASMRALEEALHRHVGAPEAARIVASALSSVGLRHAPRERSALVRFVEGHLLPVVRGRIDDGYDDVADALRKVASSFGRASQLPPPTRSFDREAVTQQITKRGFDEIV